MTLLAVAKSGAGVVDPSAPVIHADNGALLRGRAAFETMRVYAGRPFRYDEHLSRLTGSAERIGLPPVDRAELDSLVRDALDAAGSPDAVLRLYWTPGREHGSEPQALVLVSALPESLEEIRAKGITLISLSLGLDTEQRPAAPWVLDGVKSTSYAVNMAVEAEAKKRGADDAIFLDRAGNVLECPVSNVWWRYGSRLETPSLELGILAGVTRGEVLRLGKEAGLEVVEGTWNISHLRGADEVFTSSSVRELMPAVAVDDVEIGDGSHGPVAAELQAGLRESALAS